MGIRERHDFERLNVAEAFGKKCKNMNDRGTCGEPAVWAKTIYSCDRTVIRQHYPWLEDHGFYCDKCACEDGNLMTTCDEDNETESPQISLETWMSMLKYVGKSHMKGQRTVFFYMAVIIFVISGLASVVVNIIM